MNPEFLKRLAEITAQLRGGLTQNPLDEMQKRATQFGEGVGLQLEKDRAQAGYAKSHPESARAQQERIVNAAMFALGVLKPGEKPELRAAIKSHGKVYDDLTHAHAYMRAGVDLSKPTIPKNEGFIDQNNKWLSRQAAENLMDRWMSKSVKAQMKERSRQAGRPMGMTAEDVNGKLYANRGTNADEPMTLADFDRIMAKKKGRAAMDSVATKLAPPSAKQLHKLLTENKGFTVDPRTGEAVSSGYAVGGGNQAGILLKKNLAELQPKELQTWLDQNAHKIAPDQALGGWVDDQGVAYIEPSTRVSDLNEAQRLGNERGEKAIWDHANKADIPLKAQKADAAAEKTNEVNDVLNRWHAVFNDYRKTGDEVRSFPDERRKSLANALRQHDIERPGGGSPEKIADVEELAYKTFKGPQFLKWLEAGRGTGSWYDTRKTQSQAIDALGEKLGPEAFNDLIDHMAASTAMSRPENNLRRASWWKALHSAGLLDPAALRSSTLSAPEGFGHIAQKSHHTATADLIESGRLNPLANPKPASFAENLKMNWRPYTNDSRMSTATLAAQPKLSLGLAGVQGDATPRKWAYAPMERAAQRAASELHGRGLVDAPPDGVDPVAAWQAQVWGGIGRENKTRMMSTNNPSFSDIVDKLLARSAKLWGVSPAQATELFWKGQPLDLPLNASLLKGPARPRKK